MQKVIAYQVLDKDGNMLTPIIYPFEGARRQVVVTPASFVRVEIAETETTPRRFEVVVAPAVLRDETDDEFLARIGAKDVPAGVEYRLVDASTVPADDAALPDWYSGLGGAAGVGIGQEAWFAAEAQAVAVREAELQAAHNALVTQIEGENNVLRAEWQARQSNG